MTDKLRMFKTIVVEEELAWPVDGDKLAGFVNRIITWLYHEPPAGARKEVRLVEGGFAAQIDGATMSLRLTLEVREDP